MTNDHSLTFPPAPTHSPSLFVAYRNLEHNQISLIHYRSFESLAQLVQL